jgi:hypothetical protein
MIQMDEMTGVLGQAFEFDERRTVVGRKLELSDVARRDAALGGTARRPA